MFTVKQILEWRNPMVVVTNNRNNIRLFVMESPKYEDCFLIQMYKGEFLECSYTIPNNHVGTLEMYLLKGLNMEG